MDIYKELGEVVYFILIKGDESVKERVETVKKSSAG